MASPIPLPQSFTDKYGIPPIWDNQPDETWVGYLQTALLFSLHERPTKSPRKSLEEAFEILHARCVTKEAGNGLQRFTATYLRTKAEMKSENIKARERLTNGRINSSGILAYLSDSFMPRRLDLGWMNSTRPPVPQQDAATVRCHSDGQPRGRPLDRDQDGPRRATSEDPRFLSYAEDTPLQCPRPTHRIEPESLLEHDVAEHTVAAKAAETSLDSDIQPLIIPSLGSSTFEFGFADVQVEEPGSCGRSDKSGLSVSPRSALQNNTNLPITRQYSRSVEIENLRTLPISRNVQLLMGATDHSLCNEEPRSLSAPPARPTETTTSSATTLLPPVDTSSAEPRTPMRYSFVPYKQVTSRKPRRKPVPVNTSLSVPDIPSDCELSPIKLALREYKERVATKDKAPRGPKQASERQNTVPKHRHTQENDPNHRIWSPTFRPEDPAQSSVLGQIEAPRPSILDNKSPETRPALRKMPAYTKPTRLNLQGQPKLSPIEVRDVSPTASEYVAAVKEKHMRAIRTPLGERKLNIPSSSAHGEMPDPNRQECARMKENCTPRSDQIERRTLTPKICRTNDYFPAEIGALADITSLGSNRKPKGFQLKMPGRTNSPVYMRVSPSESPSRQKENIPPLSKRKVFDSIASFFRMPSPLSKRLDTRSPAESIRDIPQEQVDRLIQSLAPTATPIPGIAGGGRYFSFVPTIDESPTREQKQKNPVAVCMDFLESAERLPEGEQKENLLRMSQVIVQYVERASFAHQSVEAAQVLTQAELAELNTAQAVVSNLEAQLKKAKDTMQHKTVSWLTARKFEKDAAAHAHAETVKVRAAVDVFVAHREHVQLNTPSPSPTQCGL